MIRTYTELSRFETFEERFDYLKLGGSVGRVTFGAERYLNQKFYTSREWRYVRPHVIARDLGRDLGVEGFDILHGQKLLIHHINPVSIDDLTSGNADIFDPEYLITTCHDTHNAIHYGDASLLPKQLVERKPGDTIPWR